MENEKDNVESKNNEELDLELDNEEAPAPEKPKESPEAKLARLKRQTEQLEKKLGVKKEEPEPKSKSNDLDYGQKAFLKSYGVQGSDELQLVREYLENGKSLDDIPNNRHFQNDLGELREARFVKQAIPSGTARTNSSARDTVEYWIAKGEMPPREDIELSRKVLNARIAKESSSNRFTSNPIVEGGSMRH